jgi:Phage tail assembly chaperone.
MALIGRNQIDTATDLRHEDVDVPEWGGQVRLRELTSKERSLIEATTIGAKGQSIELRIEAFKTLREKTVVAALIDENGKRLYEDKEAAQLGLKSGQVIERLFQKVQELSGMTQAAVKDAEGNSAGTGIASSGSDSPKN